MLTSILIFGLVATVLGAGIGFVTLSTRKQVERQVQAAQAHYYAKTGVELAMGLIYSHIDSLNAVLDTWYYGSIDQPFTTEPNNPPDHNIAFQISLLDDTLMINSRGYVRNSFNLSASEEAVGYVISLEQLRETIDQNHGGMPLALFADEMLKMTGSTTIMGNVATNANTAKTVVFEGTAHISQGELFIGVNGDPELVLSIPYASAPSKQIKVNNLDEKRVYPLPNFPQFPNDLPYRGSVSTASQDAFIIEEDGYYDLIQVVSDRKLEIDLKGGTRTLRVKNFKIEQGTIELRNVGSNSLLQLYVEDQIVLTGSSKVNEGGNPRTVVIYYSGTSEINFGGSTKLVGSLFAKQAKIVITDSGGVHGDIVTGGNNVTVEGDADVVTRVIYAPKASLNSTGSGKVKGTVIVASAVIEGDGCHITSDTTLDLTFFQSLDWPSGRAPSLLIGDVRARGSWQDKGEWRLGTL